MSDPSLPLSAVQRQFWLTAQIHPDNTAYNVCGLFRISGPLNVAALEGALGDWIAAHDVLRSSYALEDGEPRMRVAAATRFELPVERVTAQQAEQLVAEEQTRSFDLTRGPLVRARLWEISERADHFVLSLCMHHIVVDLASKELASAEIAARYRARTGAPATPQDAAAPRPLRPYRDYLLQQQAWPASAARARAIDYFTEQVPRDWPALALPEDRSRPALQSLHGEVVRAALGTATSGALAELARELKTRDFLILLALYGVVLAKYASQDRVMIGVPFSNRRSQALRETFGCFVNTLPVPLLLEPSTTLRDVLGRLRNCMLGHHRHQELGTSEIVEALAPVRDTSRNPLYQAGFTFEPPMELPLAGLQVQSDKVHAGGAQLDLFLTAWNGHEGLCLQLEYASRIFDRETIEGLVESYRTLVDALVGTPALLDAPLSELSILSERDINRLAAWNATDRDYATGQRVQQLFEAQARRTPERVALAFGDAELSYAALDAAANALAHTLLERGVQPDEAVGLFGERSLELVVGIYGILKAGAAYVPLDPEYPAQRLAHMLEDAAPRLVVTTPGSRQAAPPGASLVVVELGARAERAPSLPQPTATSPAYIIFTSGSTGRPKGAMNGHVGIVNRILWMQEALQLGEDDVVLHKTPFSFDVSTWEFFWPLCVGARLEIAEPGAHRDPDALQALIRARGVTTLHFVPSMLHVFLEHPRAHECVSLHTVVVSGEALSNELQLSFFRVLAQAALHNLYGPTEAAVDVTHHACDRAHPQAPVPIGRPIANTQIHILDTHQKQVPIGATGELHIGGVQVGLGYVNREALTKERFLPDPFASTPGARMYRTGDLARHRNDGNIEYLGRLDHQIKLRGLRIELSEIEAVLARHPDLGQVVVSARRVGTGELSLVAHVTPSRADAKPGGHSDADLRRHAAAELPDYMVPAHFLWLDAMPLLPNGKVDRAALPDPEPLAAARADFVPPKAGAEQRLAELWCSLLGLPQVPADANFFELGGSSLLCARMIVPLRQWYSERVPLVALFEHTSVRALAAYLEANHAGDAADTTQAAATTAERRAVDQAVQRAALRRKALSRKR